MNNLDTFTYVSKYVPLEQLSNLGLVCRCWRAYEGKVWEVHAKMFYGKELNVPNFKAFLQEHWLRSNDDIVSRFQNFMRRVSYGQNARFRCLIGNRAEAVDVVIKTDSRRLPKTNAWERYVRDFDFTESYIAFNGLGNGSLRRTLPPAPYHPTSMQTQGYLRIPRYGTALAQIFIDPRAGFRAQTDLSSRLVHIVSQRFATFDTLRRRGYNLVELALVAILIFKLYTAFKKCFDAGFYKNNLRNV